MSVHLGGRGPGHLVRTGAFAPGALAALDFQLQQYRTGTGSYYIRDLTALTGWSFTRASTKTAQNSAGQVLSFGSGVPAITDLGFLIEEARTNSLLNSNAPATQTTGSLGAGTYTLWVVGTGSAAVTAGTGTATGLGTATAASAVTFTVTVTGTFTVTVTGSLSFFQLENGAFATSRIATAGVTATRAADAASISGLSAQIGLTLYVEFIQSAPAIGNAASYDDTTSNNRIQLGSNSGLISAGATAGAVAQFFNSWTVPVTGTTTQITKAAFAAASGDANIYTNGSSVFSTGTFTVPTSTRLAIGMDRLNAAQINGYVRRVALYGSRLSNAQLQGLTQ